MLLVKFSSKVSDVFIAFPCKGTSFINIFPWKEKFKIKHECRMEKKQTNIKLARCLKNSILNKY